MSIALKTGSDGRLARIGPGESIDADSLERQSGSGNLVVGSGLGAAEELRLGSTTATSLIRAMNDLQVDGIIDLAEYIEFTAIAAPGAPASAGLGRLYSKTGDDGLFWHPNGGVEVDLTAGGATDFLDSVFRISDDADNTKKIAFQASGITTATVRTITMPDSDLTLLVPAGLAGGQTIRGGTAASENLILESTSNATKGDIILAAASDLQCNSNDVYNVQTLTSNGPQTQTTAGATLTINLSTGMHHRITLASNITTINITDPRGAGHFTLEFIQDATGGRTVTGWPANVFWPGGTDPVFGDAANARRLVSLYYNGTTEDDYYGEFRTTTYS